MKCVKITLGIRYWYPVLEDAKENQLEDSKSFQKHIVIRHIKGQTQEN